MSDKKTPTVTSPSVNQFLAKLATTPVKSSAGKARLIFAMDATASREPSWDHACHLQGEMFAATDALGGLSVQLCYYRGFAEFQADPWCDNTSTLLNQMLSVRCLGGHTRIKRVLEHTLTSHEQRSVQAVVFVSDAMEENPDTLCQLAGKLGLLNIPLFMFQEGQDVQTRHIFTQMAECSGGAYAPFDLNSAHELKQLLSAVAVFAAGGRLALEDYSRRSGDNIERLTRQLK